MLFNSFKFLFFFLPVVLFISYRLRGQKLLGWLVFASLVFYSYAGHAWFVLPMLFTSSMDFFLARQMERSQEKNKKALLVLSLLLNLSLLGWFKYSGMMLRSVQALSQMLGHPISLEWYDALHVILPSGISFYTFQTMAYMLDVYSGNCEAEKKYLRYLCFIAFFPHLIAGPITRHHQLIPQLESIEKTGPRPRWEAGLFLFTVGLAKKVLIADRIGTFLDPILSDMHGMEFLTGWLTMVSYGMQLYFDFSGYSDMAIGLGRLFGVELPQNFNRPFTTKNPADYWKRWHITLSSWLTTYLYTAIAMTGGESRTARWRPHVNIIATMFVAGIWHGANWTFAVYGLYHGVLIASYHLLKKRWNKWNASFQVFLNFVLVTLSWVFFRSSGFAQVSDWFKSAFGFHGLRPSVLLVPNTQYLLVYTALALVIVFKLPSASLYEKYEKLPAKMQAGLGAMASVTLLLMNYSSKFLYYQF